MFLVVRMQGLRLDAVGWLGFLLKGSLKGLYKGYYSCYRV